MVTTLNGKQLKVAIKDGKVMIGGACYWRSFAGF